MLTLFSFINIFWGIFWMLNDRPALALINLLAGGFGLWASIIFEREEDEKKD